jgi:hypothetical protein
MLFRDSFKSDRKENEKMKARWIEPASDADEKQEARFETWLSGEGIPFVSPEAEEDYKAKVALIKDAIQLKKTPRRIPICPSLGFFPVQYAGVSMYDAMYDYDALTRAKEIVGPTACIAGNVPLSLLCTASPDDVKAYCKELIDVAGKDGGFIFTTGAGMQGSRPENVKAMIDFSKDYGIYK